MPHRPTLSAFGILAAALVACQPADRADEPDAEAADRFVVDVSATDFEFDMPERIPSGWTTFRFANEGEQEHFLYVYRLPEGMSMGRFKEELMAPFGRVWNQYAAGELTRAEAERAFGEELPGWFFTDVTPSGGVALTEPGDTARATVQLEPGTYIAECYVKTPQGTYHTERGMQRTLVVTPESNGASPPEPDAAITLSNYEIEMTGSLEAGTRTIAVRVAENPEGFMMHDVNLVRMEEETRLEDLVAWMDWMDLEQFRAPAPGHSLGGVEHLAAGRTGYVTVDLEPGRYAWVSEGYGARGMVHEFTVD